MKVLGIDTSSKVASICVMDDDEVILEYTINSKKTHSQKLMTMIENAFEISDLTMDDIDLIGVCTGPGSFTGLRIGVATAKAIAHVKKIPLVQVNTLESLAFNMSETSSVICPIVNAQRNDVYTNKYVYEQNMLVSIGDLDIKNIDELLEDLSSKGESVVMLGDAATMYKDKIDAFDNIHVASSSHRTSRASSICQISKMKNLNNQVCDYLEINPMYIRKSQAEVDYEKKQKRNEDETK